MNNSNKNTYIFENAPISKAIYEMVIPTIFAQIVVLIYNLADTFFIGRVNNPYMVAATSLILPAYNVAVSVAGLSGVGGGALISRLLGSKKFEEAERVSTFSIELSIGIAGLLSILAFVFMTPLLNLLGAGDETRLFAEQYTMCVLVIGGIPTVLSGTMAHLLRSTGASKTARNGITIGSLLNIVLDPIFMFVIFPSGMEIIGVGLATMVSNVVVCIYYCICIFNSTNTTVNFNPRLGLPQAKSIISIFAIGFPSAVSTLCYDVASMTMNHLMAGYSNIALASVGLAMKAERLPLNVGTGICQGTMPLVAYNFASGNKKRMLDIIKGSIFIGVSTALCSLVVYEVFSVQIIRIFIENGDTVALGSHFLRIRAIATPLMFLVYFIMTMFQGIGDARKAMAMGVLRWGVFNIIALLVMNELFGMTGIVWAQTVSDTFTLILSIILSRKVLLHE